MVRRPFKIVAFVQIETDDERLDPDSIDVSTAAKVRALRQAITSNLKKITRVIGVMHVEEARLMMQIREQVLKEVGLETIVQPPPDYEPPGGR